MTAHPAFAIAAFVVVAAFLITTLARLAFTERRLGIIEKTLANWPPPPPAALSEKDIRRMIVAERDRVARTNTR